MLLPGHSHCEQCRVSTAMHVSPRSTAFDSVGVILELGPVVVTAFQTLVELMNSDAFWCCPHQQTQPVATTHLSSSSSDTLNMGLPSAWNAYHPDACMSVSPSSCSVLSEVNVHLSKLTLSTRLCRFSLRSALLLLLVAALIWVL